MSIKQNDLFSKKPKIDPIAGISWQLKVLNENMENMIAVLKSIRGTIRGCFVPEEADKAQSEYQASFAQLKNRRQYGKRN